MVSSSGWAANIRILTEGSEFAICSRRESRLQLWARSACQFMLFGLTGKNSQCLSISIQCTYIYVNIAPLHALRLAAVRQISIDQRAQVLIRTAAIEPQTMKLSKVFAGHFECAPYPF